MAKWTQQVPGAAMWQEPTGLGHAAQGLAEDAAHAPGRAGPVFGRVAEITLVGTTVLNGALAAIHLWCAPTRHRPAGHTDHENDYAPRRLSGRDSGHHVRSAGGIGHCRSHP